MLGGCVRARGGAASYHEDRAAGSVNLDALQPAGVIGEVPLEGNVRLVPPEKKVAPGMTASGKLRCKNFGCQCEFDETDNHEGACRHHVEPPIFHDTRKWWSCCEGASARPLPWRTCSVVPRSTGVTICTLTP